MLESRWYEDAPWSFAVPLRPSRFVAIRPADAEHDVEVDLAAIAPFGSPASARPKTRGDARAGRDALLYSDYRSVMGFYLCRVGAGRSGYHRGAYLKGIGRTPLAFNWAHDDDRFFATGHLPASGGVREIVVSRYLEAKGASRVVNPCRGLLIAELAGELRDPSSWLRRSELPALPCDRALQTIAVKDGRFARFSNVVWHLNHLSLFKGETDLIRFFTLLADGLRPRDAIDDDSLVPSAIARSLAAAIECAVDGYRELHRLGVSFLSVQTDPAMDGRYQDIDVPVFHGPGYVGAFGKLESFTPGSASARLPHDMTYSAVFGFGVIDYLHAMRLFVRYLRSTLAVYRASEFTFSDPERGFIDGFLRAIDEALPPDHLLWSGAACAATLKAWIDAEHAVTARCRAAVFGLVDAAVASRLDATSSEHVELPVDEVPLAAARIGARVKFTDAFYAIAGSAPRPERLDEARFLNEIVRGLDAVTDRDEMCARVAEAEASILRHCGAAP